MRRLAESLRVALTFARKERRRILFFFFELALIWVFKTLYGLVRLYFGSAVVPPSYALANAELIIGFEQALGFFTEQHVQALFLSFPAFIKFMNLYYGFLHFFASTVVLVYLFWRDMKHYYKWRTVFFMSTTLALVGFALFPTMPPRLLTDCVSKYGGCSSKYSFVDTIEEIGGFWSWRSKRMESITNHYAAMPSVHTIWAIWCSLALFPFVKARMLRTVLGFYPLFTIFCIIVTANHYWMDVTMGCVCVAVSHRGLALLEKQWTSQYALLPQSEIADESSVSA